MKQKLIKSNKSIEQKLPIEANKRRMEQEKVKRRMIQLEVTNYRKGGKRKIEKEK